MKSGIYQILNKVNGKSYVGSAVDIEKRWIVHRSNFNNNKREHPYLHNAWDKYGEEAFQFNVLEYVQNPQWLIEIEQYWIDFLETANPLFGYNACPIAGNNMGLKLREETKIKIGMAHKGKIVSEETRKKLSDANKGRNNWLGKKLSEKHKQSLSAAAKGRKHTEETKKKLRERSKGNKNAKGNKSRLGKPHTEEAKKKISETKRRLKEMDLIKHPYRRKPCLTKTVGI
jgi:group I intron endonuclease